MSRPKTAAYVAGLLVANSAPHLATAVTGRPHMTPLAGPASSPRVNLVWGAANLVGGLALIRRAGTDRRTWDARLVAFDAGVATFGVWMALTEWATRLNWTVYPDD